MPCSGTARSDTAARFHALDRFQAAIHHAPEVGLEDFVLVGQRDLFQPAEHGNARIVDPGVDAAKTFHGSLPDTLDIAGVADVGSHRGHQRSLAAQFARQLVQRLGAARGKDQLCALFCCHACCGQADAACGAGDHDDLLADVAEFNWHDVFLLLLQDNEGPPCGARCTVRQDGLAWVKQPQSWPGAGIQGVFGALGVGGG